MFKLIDHMDNKNQRNLIGGFEVRLESKLTLAIVTAVHQEAKGKVQHAIRGGVRVCDTYRRGNEGPWLLY